MNVTRSLLLAATIMTAACSGAGDDATATPSEGERLVAASQGLCDARGLADAGDEAGAARAFEDRVHAYLHDLADRLSTFDRESAGELLVAKQRVEEAIRAEAPDAAEVSMLMADLQRELADAAAAAGLRAAPCEGGVA